ncbi:hypothetical protein D3C76_624080 [compost metagenome]
MSPARESPTAAGSTACTTAAGTCTRSTSMARWCAISSVTAYTGRRCVCRATWRFNASTTVVGACALCCAARQPNPASCRRQTSSGTSSTRPTNWPYARCSTPAAAICRLISMMAAAMCWGARTALPASAKHSATTRPATCSTRWRQVPGWSGTTACSLSRTSAIATMASVAWWKSAAAAAVRSIFATTPSTGWSRCATCNPGGNASSTCATTRWAGARRRSNRRSTARWSAAPASTGVACAC